MQRLGGAVILMQINIEQIEFLVGNADVLKQISEIRALPMFYDKVMNFLEDLSRLLMKNKKARIYQDVVSYAYWIRRSSLFEVKRRHQDYENRIGRGVAFHIAPSNVPVNFAVSMTSSLLAGNGCIIRVSDKRFEQVDIICNAINELLDKRYHEMKPYFVIIRYAHSDSITTYLSSLCDIRIIWGGDRTVQTIRKIPLPVRAIEMTFADRHSLAVIHADEYLKQDPDQVAKGFYTDTYYTDQNACSSPRLVVWIGQKKQEARERFWAKMNEIVVRDYPMKPIQAVDKYTTLCKLGMQEHGVRLISENNYIVRVEMSRLDGSFMCYKPGGGYFFEYEAEELSEIVPVLNKSCQTVAVLGIDKRDVKELVFRNGVRGVDRIVLLGQTMGLEFIWDGYKMIEEMTRFVYN